MKKVLMVASESSHFKNFHLPYIKRLLDNNVEVHTASNGEFSFGKTVHIQLGFRKKLTSPANLGVILKLARLIRKERYDAVYTNSTLAGFAGRAAAVLSGVKAIECRHICHGYLFNDDGGARGRLYLMFEKLVRRRTDLLAVMNADDLEIARAHKLGKEIVFLDGMGLDVKKLPPLPGEELRRKREELCKNGEEMLFLCVGEFSPRKNQAAILRAFAGLKRADSRLIFAGAGELLGECKALAAELGISGKTTFLGHCTEMNALYRACDCLISASRFEGLPFNVMEALYCGESIIVSDVKGNRDLAAPSGLYPYNDERRMAELMERAVPGSGASALPERYLLENVIEKNVILLRLL